MGTEVADKRAGLKAGLLLLLPQVNSKGKMKTSSIGKCEKKNPKTKNKTRGHRQKTSLAGAGHSRSNAMEGKRSLWPSGEAKGGVTTPTLSFTSGR